MATDFSIVDTDDVEIEFSDRGRASNRDLSSALGCEKLTPRLWHLEPGQSMSLHRHEDQEEFYYLIEGPGYIRLDGDLHDISIGGAVRVSPAVSRQLVNDGASIAKWLVVAAPPRHHDGIHL